MGQAEPLIRKLTLYSKDIDMLVLHESLLVQCMGHTVRDFLGCPRYPGILRVLESMGLTVTGDVPGILGVLGSMGHTVTGLLGMSQESRYSGIHGLTVTGLLGMSQVSRDT